MITYILTYYHGPKPFMKIVQLCNAVSIRPCYYMVSDRILHTVFSNDPDKKNFECGIHARSIFIGRGYIFKKKK